MGVNERKQKMFIVTYTDYGETCDGHSRYMGAYATRKAAQYAIDTELALVKANYGEVAIHYKELNEVWGCEEDIGTVGCVFDIHEIPDSDLREVL
jgi:hypothetical protein